MDGLFALSVNAQSCDPEDFGEDLCGGVSSQRGPDEERMVFCTRRHARQAAMETFFMDDEDGEYAEIIATLNSPDGIACCGEAQGVCRRSSQIGWIGLCVLAELINFEELRRRFADAKQPLGGTRDEITAKIISYLIAGEETVLDGIIALHRAGEGAYALLILAPDGVYVAQSTDVEFPLVIGKKKGAVAVASEGEVLEMVGFNDLREVVPGEILRLMSGIAVTVDTLKHVELEGVV